MSTTPGETEAEEIQERSEETTNLLKLAAFLGRAVRKLLQGDRLAAKETD